MKVIFWSERYLPEIGGVEIFSASLIDILAERGFEFVVIAGMGEGDYSDFATVNGVEVNRFPIHQSLQSNDLRSIGGVRRGIGTVLSRFEPDLIHLNTCGPSLFYYLHSSAARMARSTILTVHSPIQETLGSNGIFDRVARSVDYTTAVSNAVLEDLLERVPAFASRSRTIHNGLPAPSAQPTPLVWNPPRLLCIGRLIAEKGFDTAIRAFRKVLEWEPGADLTIVGDGPEAGNLNDLAVGLGLANRIRFTGPVEPDRIADMINYATLLVVPSRRDEPFGLVALQAAQLGRPVVATRVGGLPEVVLDDVSGILVPKDDVASMAEAVIRLCADPERAGAMGAEGRRFSIQKFSMAGCASSYEAVYRRLGMHHQAGLRTHNVR